MKSFGFYSVCKLLSSIYMYIKSTKMKFVPTLSVKFVHGSDGPDQVTVEMAGITKKHLFKYIENFTAKN